VINSENVINISFGVTKYNKEGTMPLISGGAGLLILGIISLIAGIIVMIFPKILNYLIGIYLILSGIIAIIIYL